MYNFEKNIQQEVETLKSIQKMLYDKDIDILVCNGPAGSEIEAVLHVNIH